jgi:hypothetical protein
LVLPCRSHLYDYGVSGGFYWVVLRAYHTSLKAWRGKISADTADDSLGQVRTRALSLPRLLVLVASCRVGGSCSLG